MSADGTPDAERIAREDRALRRRVLRRRPRRELTDDQIRTANERLKLTQRRVLAIAAGVVAAAQIVCADVVFVLYAALGEHWDVPASAIEAWLASTVVQVIGIVLVITRSLFPAPSAET